MPCLRLCSLRSHSLLLVLVNDKHSIPSVRSACLLELNYPPQPGLVSVVIPSFNRARLLPRAINSALAQTYRSIQVVVADDGSTDETSAVTETFGESVTYVRQDNAGVSSARNLGIRHSRGEFIAFLDSDDSWQPWKIEAQMGALRGYPDAGLVWTDMVAVDDRDNVLAERHLRSMYGAYEQVDIERTLERVASLGSLCSSVPAELEHALVRKGDLSNEILLGNLIHTSTTLFRRSWLERTGGFDESFVKTGEDYEFYIRLCSAGPVVLIDAPSTLYRVGAEDQLTSPLMLLEIARNNLRAVKKWLPRAQDRHNLSLGTARRRLAESYAWVGEAELDAGHRLAAARRLARSLAVRPGLDRRAVLLARCALPKYALDAVRVLRRARRRP